MAKSTIPVRLHIIIGLIIFCFFNPISFTKSYELDVSVIPSAETTQDLELLLNCTMTVIRKEKILSNYIKVNVVYESVYDGHYGANLYNLGLRLRQSNKTIAVIGPKSSSGIVLFHPHTILMDVPHIFPYDSDPVVINLERFPNLIRLMPSYDFKINVILETIRSLQWNSVAIVAEHDLFFQHIQQKFLMAAQKKSIQV